jgi:hypothetical protein
VVAIVDVDNSLKVGASVVLSTPPRRLHLFNPATGLRITNEGTPAAGGVAHLLSSG